MVKALESKGSELGQLLTFSESLFPHLGKWKSSTRLERLNEIMHQTSLTCNKHPPHGGYSYFLTILNNFMK